MSRLRLFPLLARLFTLLLLIAAGASIAQNPSFPTTPPDDPLYPPQPSSTGPTGQWNLFGFIPPGNVVNHPSGISANEAWKTTIGRPDVIVAVLDSGVDYDHEDLRRQIWLNPGELPEPQATDGSFTPGVYDLNGDGVFDVEDYADDPRLADLNGSGVVDRGGLAVFVDGNDNDLNGYVDDLSGWDSDDEDGDEFDHRFFGHGTGRNGFIAAATNNSIGIAGVCPRCRLMNVRIDDTFVHSSEGLAKGALFAVDNGATVLTMALGLAAQLHRFRREGQVVQERAEAALRLATEQGFSLWVAVGTILRGWALAAQGEEEEGIAQLHQGLIAYRATGAEAEQPHYLAMLAEAYGKVGQAQEGLAVLAEALAVVQKTGECFYEAELYRLKGELLRQKSKGKGQKAKIEAEAEACFHQAIEIARRQSAKSLELRAVMSLSRLWQRQGKKEEARKRLAEIYSWFTEGFDTLDLQEARVLLEGLS